MVKTPASSITHTFDNHTHRAGVPRLGRGSNRREPTPLSLASRCGSAGPLLCPGECTATSSLQGHDRRGEVGPKKRYESPWGDLATSTLRRADAPRRRWRRTDRRQPRAHQSSQCATTSRKASSQRRAAPADQTKNNEVCGQTDRQAPTQRRQSDTGSRPDRSTSPPTRRAKRGGDRLDP